MEKKSKKSFTKSRKEKRIFLIVCAIFVIVPVWIGFIMGDMFGWSSDESRIMVKLPEGCSVHDIAEILEDDELIDYPIVFRVYEKLTGKERIYQKGGHYLTYGMSYGEILEKLTQAPEYGVDEIVKVTVPEGFENRQIADRFAELGIVSRDKFMDELEHGEFDYEFLKDIERSENRLEGYLFPATYEFFVGESEHSIICRMLDSFEANIVPIFESYETDMTLDQVVTFASIVEREAANDGERPLIASVFHNRLKKNMTLSSCATVQYILKERKEVLSISDTKIESEYNTYINEGLPVGPIASPGVNSVKAVLEPADTNYLYFAARADGSENVFSETGEEHLQTVQILQGN